LIVKDGDPAAADWLRNRKAQVAPIMFPDRQ
jgi:hypothetical protein